MHFKTNMIMMELYICTFGEVGNTFLWLNDDFPFFCRNIISEVLNLESLILVMGYIYG